MKNRQLVFIVYSILSWNFFEICSFSAKMILISEYEIKFLSSTFVSCWFMHCAKNFETNVPHRSVVKLSPILQTVQRKKKKKKKKHGPLIMLLISFAILKSTHRSPKDSSDSFNFLRWPASINDSRKQEDKDANPNGPGKGILRLGKQLSCCPCRNNFLCWDF